MGSFSYNVIYTNDSLLFVFLGGLASQGVSVSSLAVATSTTQKVFIAQLNAAPKDTSALKDVKLCIL